VRPRRRTPTWDQFGYEVPATPSLTPAEAKFLRYALDRLDEAVEQARLALDPPR